MKENIKNKNSLSDYLIWNFKNRVDKGYSLNVFETLNYLCKLYKTINDIFDSIKLLQESNLIEEFEFDKKNRFLLRLTPNRVSFLNYEIFLEINSDLKAGMGFEFKVNDVKTSKVFDSTIKNMNSFLKTEIN